MSHKLLLLVLYCGCVSEVCTASTISYAGDLRTNANFTSCGFGCTLGATNTDGDYAQWGAVSYTFVVPVATAVTATTFSYGGGTNGNGTVIAPDGFEPYLSLFNAAGDFLSSTYYGTTCPAGAQTNALLGGCYDVQLNAGTLDPGTYQIVISAFENMSQAENQGTGLLSDGFTGLGNLAQGEDLHYAFDMRLSPVVSAPEPFTASLILLGSFIVLRKKEIPNEK